MTPADLETILAQDDWLRRIARHLVRDPDLADDLVQDAWVASLESGRRGDSARPWLLGVLRNTGARLFRTARTQHERALRSAESAATVAPATDDVAAALQLRETLAREMRALDEPFRSAVYLRYVEGLSLKEAAQRADVATSTMSERVARGLELLRRRMDRASGGDRRAWALPLLPLARPKGFAAVTIGSLAMTGTMKFAVSAAAVVGLLLVGSRLISPGPVTREESVLAEADAAEELIDGTAARSESLAPVRNRESARSLDETAVEQAANPVTPTPQKMGGARIIGRFLLADGRPAAGATWNLSGRGGNHERQLEHGLPDDWTDPEGTLDGDGLLDVILDPPQAFQFTLSVRAREHVEASWRWDEVKPDETKDVGMITLSLAGRITGRVIDENGAPVVGRSLRVQANSARDPFGSLVNAREATRVGTWSDLATAWFELDGQPEGIVQLSVSTRVLGVAGKAAVRVKPGRTVAVDIVLKGVHETVTTIAIHTSRSPYGSIPAPTAEHIWLIDPDGSRRNSSRRQSSSLALYFDDVVPGIHQVVIDDPRFETWRDDDVTAGETVRARLKGSAGLQLDVRDAEGRAIDLYSVDIEFLNVNFAPRDFRPHTSEEPLAGNRLEGLVPGDYRLAVHGAAGAASATILGLGPSEVRTVGLVIGPPDVIAGRIVRSDGTPAPWIKTRLVTPAARDDSSTTAILPLNALGGTADLYRWERGRTTTDELGRFTFEMPQPGRYIVVGGEDGGPMTESPVISFVEGESTEGLELMLPSGARISGRIESPADLDLTNWRVLPDRPAAGRMQRIRVEWAHVLSDGSFETGLLPAGPVRLYLLRPGNGVGFDSDHAPRGGLLLEELVLADGQDVDRAYPFPGPVAVPVTFRVTVEGAPSGKTAVQLFTGTDRYPAVTLHGSPDHVGPALVPPGHYRALVSGQGWGAVIPEQVTITEGEPNTITLTASIEPHRIQFVQAGQPVAKRDLTASMRDGPRRLRVLLRTDNEGWAEVHLGREQVQFDLVRMAGEETGGSATAALPLPGGVSQIALD